MKILALDISSKSTGYAVFSDGILDPLSIGMIKLSHDSHGERLSVFEEQINNILIKYNPEKVIVEEIWKGPNIKTFKILSYYHGVLQNSIFKWNKINPIMLMPSEARRIISDRYNVTLVPKKNKKIKKPKTSKKKKSGKDSKELTFDFITSFFEFKDWSFDKHNDQADAIALGLAYVTLSEEKNESL